jgi:3-phenylpropionate/trans-cinnamate dioxygenase ferredoxin subunit
MRKMEWHRIATLYELQNGFMPLQALATVKINGRRYCLGRLDDGYFVIDDKCPHAGGQLSYGKCDLQGNVICPIHRFAFSLRTGRNTSGEGFAVDTYPVELRADGLWVSVPKKKWWQ